ncbi:choice-of-anchor L domain-containing protein [Winogradskyella pulchriflava]|uniref:Choice-of-anchor L domain-containing protein n=1 Tax=Winogradskyella pulchriflava TaxID=1110688 RepID=A0ABV6Q6D9_9FLAO
MKKILYVFALIVSSIGFSQDVSMQNGTFNRCAPDRFFDSGGEFGNYGNDENFVTTICPQNTNEFVILDFTTFITQLNVDVMTIYDGDDTSAAILGTWSGPNSPGTVSASSASGCLTIEFVSNDSASGAGWEADILCATPCQDIVASIDTTVPAPNGSGVIGILPGETVDFSGSATFSVDGSNATYGWFFGDGNIGSGANVSNTFANPGTYTVVLTVTDDNPQGCSDSTTITVFVLGPNVVVDQNSFTPEQLIEDVLVNSPCATVSNIISSTGVNFNPSEPNGIGYFFSNGVDFPFEDGILLTSGDASEAGGPNNNLLGEGTDLWPGDADLNSQLLVDSHNATFIQFDFTPLADTISFDFLMASEEYDMGSFECNYSDAFAFLLTDSNGVTTNLAVLPGTTTPILVTNIHPDNGATCGGANEQYFGAYTPNNAPPIAFDGRTAVFTAQSAVVPGENYTIKLVVADDRDNIYDTGVFLRAGSFDLGGDLGEDITIAAGTAECGGTAITLDTGVTTAQHTWYFEGNVITGETGSTILASETGTYSVDIFFTGVCQANDSIFVEFKPSPTANPAQNLVVCDVDGTAEFNLSDNDDDILGVQNAADFIITYHLTEQDAIDNVGVLPTNYTNISDPQTIWARIADNSQECFATTSFQLGFSDITIDNAITPIILCDDNIADGFTSFNLTDRNAEVIGSNDASTVVVSYHLTQADADNNMSPLPEPYTNSTAYNQTIFVRLETVSNSDCYATTTLDLQVITTPQANSLTPLEACDDNNDGFTEFDLSLKDAEVLGAQTGLTVTYHLSENDAIMDIGVLPTSYTNTSSGAQLIHVRIDSDSGGCYDTTSLQLIANPVPTTVAVTPYELCDYDNSGDEQELFDLTTKDLEILNGQVNVSVAYYANQTDATTGMNEITGLYANISNPETIVAVLTNTNTGCQSSVTFELVVHPLPSLIPPTALEVCDDGTPDGLTEIDLSLKNIEITGNNPGYTVSYYLTQADADNAANPLAIPYTNISNPQIIFVRVEDNTTGCYDTTTLELGVEQAPVANTPEPLRYCDPDNDGFGMFTLTDAENDITIGAAGLTVTYHETMANAENNVDAIDTTVDYNNIVINTQTLYARVESETIATDCATIVELVLIVEPSPQIVAPSPLHACDDASADGYAMFDLTTKAPEVLNGLDPMQYTVSYYETEADANAPMNPIANPNAYTNTQEDGQFIWIRVEDGNTVEGCYKVTSLELIVNPLPVLLQPSPLELCDVDNPGDEQEPFTLEDANAEILNGQTGITLTYYETQQDADNGTSPIASPYINTSNAQTIYIRGENDNTGCYSTVTLTLRVNPLPSPEQDPEPIEVCDDDNDGFAEFDLTIRTVAITNGESDVVISYHETQEDAEMGDNPLSSPYTNIVANSQMIYVRSESTLTGCYRLTLNTLELVVVASPEVPTSLDPLIICDADADGIAQFDLTERDADILGIQNPADVTLTYHVNASDAQSGNNPIINVGNYTNTGNPQTIYVRLYNPTSDCYDTGEFELQVELPPTAVQPTPLELCDDLGESPGNEMTEFDLTVKDQEITGGNASWSVAYYETNADAQAQTGAIPDPTAYTNTSVGGLPANPQTLYVVVTDTDTGCVDYTTLTIRVLPNPTPTPSDQLPDLELCDEINTGDGFEIFDLTENEVLLLNGENGVTATYHETPEDSDSGMNAIVDPTQYTNIETPEQTIYVRVTNDVTGCYTLVDFTIRVNPLPEVVAVTDFIQCELNTDGFDSFDLTTKDEEVLNGQDPTQFIVTYHENLADAESGMNALVSPYINTTNPQQIFVTITNNVTGCSISTQSFNIQVDEAAEANPDMDPILYEECDDHMETDGDPSNDSVQFDLSTQDAQVLDGQNPTDYIVSYYATEEDANLNVNPLPNLYENVVNPQVIYARVDNNTLTVIPVALDLAALTAGLDLDANGTIDTYDTDADGIFDLIDVDGDGLSDGIDANADGLFEYVDIDGDGNGDPVDLNNDGTFDNQADSSICFAVAELTLQVNPLPNFDLADSYILCVNTNGTEILDPLVLDTELSETDYTFEWSLDGNVLVGETGSSLNPLQGGTYSVIVTDISTSTVTQCVNMDSTVVIESEPPTLVADVVTQAFANNHVIEAVASGPGVYEYSLDGGPWQDSGTFTNVSSGEHEVVARDKNGCGIAVETVFVLDYPLYFTPNGDGNHDTWNIEGIGSSAKIYIFDRYGKLLKQLSPTGPGWDGTFNGNRMPSNGYWFTVEYDEPLTGKRKEFKAHFTLKR